MDESTESISSNQRRFSSSLKVRETYEKLYADSATRCQKIATIQNQLNRAAPYSDSKLRESGQADRSNINFGDAAAMSEEKIESYWSLVNDPANLIKCEVTGPGEVSQSQQKEEVFQDAFTRFIREDWNFGYTANFMLLAKEYVNFGVGTGIFDSFDSPRYTAIKAADVIVPGRMKLFGEKQDLIFIPQELSPSELWDYIHDESSKGYAKAAGWNVDFVEQLLVDAKKGYGHCPVGSSDYLRIVEEFRENSFGLATSMPLIKVIHAYVKEYDGKISHQIFLQTIDKKNSDAYLFDDYGIEKRAEKMNEAVFFLFAEVGHGTFQSVKGYGHKNFFIADVITRTRNDMIDRVGLTDGLSVVSSDDGPLKKGVSVIRSGGLTIFPKSLTPVNVSPGNGYTETVLSSLENLTQRNNSQFSNQNALIASANTKSQGEIIAGNQQKMQVSVASFFLAQLGVIFAEQFRRLKRKGSLDPDAKAFRKRCLDSQVFVSEQEFDSLEVSVFCGADAGAEAAGTRLQNYAQMIKFSGLPDVNPRFGIEGFVTTAFGRNSLKQALSPDDSQYKDDEQARIAFFENAMFNLRNPVIVARADRHDIHIPVHLNVVSNVADLFQKNQIQLTPELYENFRLSVEHLSQHFQYMKQDFTKKAVFAAYFPKYSSVVNTLAQMEAQIRKATQAQAAAQMGGNAEQIPQQQSLVDDFSGNGPTPNELRTQPNSNLSQLEAQSLSTEGGQTV